MRGLEVWRAGWGMDVYPPPWTARDQRRNTPVIYSSHLDHPIVYLDNTWAATPARYNGLVRITCADTPTLRHHFISDERLPWQSIRLYYVTRHMSRTWEWRWGHFQCYYDDGVILGEEINGLALLLYLYR